MLSPEVAAKVRSARDLLLKESQLIEQARDEVGRRTMNFRQVEPPVRQKTLAALDDALGALVTCEPIAQQK